MRQGYIYQVFWDSEAWFEKVEFDTWGPRLYDVCLCITRERVVQCERRGNVRSTGSNRLSQVSTDIRSPSASRIASKACGLLVRNVEPMALLRETPGPPSTGVRGYGLGAVHSSKD